MGVGELPARADDGDVASRVPAAQAVARARGGSSEAPQGQARRDRIGSPVLGRQRRPARTGPRRVAERPRPAPRDSGRVAPRCPPAAAPPRHGARTRPRIARLPTAWPADGRTRGAQSRAPHPFDRLPAQVVRPTAHEARRPDPPRRFAPPRYRPVTPADFSLITRSARRTCRRRSGRLWCSRSGTNAAAPRRIHGSRFPGSHVPGTRSGSDRRRP